MHDLMQKGESMDILTDLIMIKKIDYTERVVSVEAFSNKVKIRLANGKEYTPWQKNVYISKLQQEVNLNDKLVFCNGNLLSEINKLLDFGAMYRIIYKSGVSIVNSRRSIRLEMDLKNEHKALWQYWNEIAQYAKIGNTDGQRGSTFLAYAFQQLSYIHPESVLAQYLQGECKKQELDDFPLIFPFDFNQSQQEAIVNALTNSISIIEGPPGTGKTQTILNMLANFVAQRDLKVAMVSGTNEAVRNVQEKMEREGYGFLLADLGRKEKQKTFFQNLPQANVSQWEKEIDASILEDTKEISRLFLKEREEAQIQQSLSAYRLEQEHFNRYYDAQNYHSIENLSVFRLPADKIVDFLAETQLKSIQTNRLSFLYKLKLFLKYRFKEFSLLSEMQTQLVLDVQRQYYQAKIQSLLDQIQQIEQELKQSNFNEKRRMYQEKSQKILKAALANRYANCEKPNFQQDSFKQQFDKFVSYYPVILSTTFSLANSISNGFLFDYLIIDESSQVDLLSGVLALACCKHAVIVGDTKQLPQIIDESIEEKLTNCCPNFAYDYFHHSILSSMISVYQEKAAKKLLQEHYRCEPAIIQFCNQRYYDGQLIVLKKETSENTPLILYRTAFGNHMRTVTKGENLGKYNQRELDTILAEVLTDPERLPTNVGFTTPYVKQAEKAGEHLPKEIECDTIHKYQGRQKEIMILSTVLDNTRFGRMGLRFVDDPNKINVAVSRAERQFILVTDRTLFSNAGKELKALIGYMEYHLLDAAIVDSEVVSVFDLLYKEFSRTLLEFGSRLPRVSRYESENAMFKLLSNILEEADFRDFSFAFQVLMKNLLLNTDKLSDEEILYVNNRASLDFVVYNKSNKLPALAIEVDGFASHENNPEQQKRDIRKNHILQLYNIPLLRLPTNGSEEANKIRAALKPLL